MPTRVSTVIASDPKSETVETSETTPQPQAGDVKTPTRRPNSPEHGDEHNVSSTNADDGFDSPESAKVPMHPITPAISKRRQATKHIVINSPTDNIFSPITKKLLGRKRNDPARVLPDN